MTTTTLDRVLPLGPAEIEELKRPQSVIEAAMNNANTTEGWKSLIEYGKLLKKVGQISGVNMAQYLYLLRSAWPQIKERFSLGDELIDILGTELGVTVGTFKKYTRAWAALYGTAEGEGNVPAKLRAALLARPIEQQLLLTAAAPEINFTQWNIVAKAHDKAGVKAVVRQVRGERTSAVAAINIWVKRDGSLVAKQGKNGKMINLGVLRNSDADMADPVRAAAIERILRAAGIQEA